jgi:hypothetical protein
MASNVGAIVAPYLELTVISGIGVSSCLQAALRAPTFAADLPKQQRHSEQSR